MIQGFFFDGESAETRRWWTAVAGAGACFGVAGEASDIGAADRERPSGHVTICSSWVGTCYWKRSCRNCA
jgi:hypothetical protein